MNGNRDKNILSHIVKYCEQIEEMVALCDNFDYTIWRREYFDKMDLDLYRWDIIPGAITEARVSAYITGTAKR